MPKYFMSGTRYESFERMMMTPPTHGRSEIASKMTRGAVKSKVKGNQNLQNPLQCDPLEKGTNNDDCIIQGGM